MPAPIHLTEPIQTAAARWLARVAPKGGLMRSASALGGATFAMQVTGVLLSPVYSRLYTPADYGMFAVYSAIVATALTVGSFCYETGIPVGEDESEAAGLTTAANSFAFSWDYWGGTTEINARVSGLYLWNEHNFKCVRVNPKNL